MNDDLVKRLRNPELYIQMSWQELMSLAADRIEKLETAIDERGDEIDKLTVEVDDVGDEIGHLERRVEKLKDEVRDLREKVK